MTPRGVAVTKRRARLARPTRDFCDETVGALLRSKKRLRRKTLPRHAELMLRSDVPSPIRKKFHWANCVTPAQRTSLGSMYGAPRKGDRSQPAAPSLVNPRIEIRKSQPAATVGHRRQEDGTPTLASDIPTSDRRIIAAVSHIIDSNVMQTLTDEGCRHALKASAWRVIKNQRLAEAVAHEQTSIVVLAVFCTAIAITGDIGAIGEERDLLRRFEPDKLIRADAYKTMRSILDIIFVSSGLAPTLPALAQES